MTTNVQPAAVAAPVAPQAPEGSPVKADARTETPKAQPDAAKPTEPAKPAEKYEIKVNGKSKLVTRDELIRLAQLSEAATERFETASQKERKAQQIIERAKSNPIEHLMDPDLGLTKEQIRAKMEEWYNREFIEPETLTAEQRRLKELERENKAFKEEQEKKRQADIQAAQEKAADEYAQHFQKQIIDAMEANKLPKTKNNVRRIAFYMRQSMANGFEAPMELVVQKVKEDRKNEDAEINDYSYDDIVDRFGEAFVNKLISENLKRLRAQRAQVSGSSFSGRTSEPSGKKPDKIDMDEANRRLRAMRLGK